MNKICGGKRTEKYPIYIQPSQNGLYFFMFEKGLLKRMHGIDSENAFAVFLHFLLKLLEISHPFTVL